MTLTDDDLGARLRSALQQVTPLATDPVPPPRFAPTALLEHPPASAEAEALDLGTVIPVARPPRPRVAVGAGVALVAAAVAAVVVGAVAIPGRPAGAPGPAAPGSPAAGPPTPATGPSTPVATVPDRGGADLGITPDPVPWRCTAPAGATLAADIDRTQVTPTVWRIGPGVTCSPDPTPEQTVTFSADGGLAYLAPAGLSPAPGDGSSTEGPFCTYVATGALGVPLSFTSRGPSDFIEFYGSGCRLVLLAK